MDDGYLFTQDHPAVNTLAGANGRSSSGWHESFWTTFGVELLMIELTGMAGWLKPSSMTRARELVAQIKSQVHRKVDDTSMMVGLSALNTDIAGSAVFDDLLDIERTWNRAQRRGSADAVAVVAEAVANGASEWTVRALLAEAEAIAHGAIEPPDPPPLVLPVEQPRPDAETRIDALVAAAAAPPH